MIKDKLRLTHKSKRVGIVVDLLKQHNVNWLSSNNGVHIVVQKETYKLDIWPTTIKFRMTNYETNEGNTFSGVDDFIDNLERYL